MILPYKYQQKIENLPEAPLVTEYQALRHEEKKLAHRRDNEAYVIDSLRLEYDRQIVAMVVNAMEKEIKRRGLKQ